MKISAVIPVYNEAATIEQIISKVRSTGRVAEIIAVDDGSGDGTRDLLKRLADEVTSSGSSITIATGARGRPCAPPSVRSRAT